MRFCGASATGVASYKGLWRMPFSPFCLTFGGLWGAMKNVLPRGPKTTYQPELGARFSGTGEAMLTGTPLVFRRVMLPAHRKLNLHTRRHPHPGPLPEGEGAGRATSRPGLTLVEMLIALACVVLLMLAYTQLFSQVSGRISDARSMIEVEHRMRSATQQLRGRSGVADLRHVAVAESKQRGRVF